MRNSLEADLSILFKISKKSLKLFGLVFISLTLAGLPFILRNSKIYVSTIKLTFNYESSHFFPEYKNYYKEIYDNGYLLKFLEELSLSRQSQKISNLRINNLNF